MIVIGCNTQGQIQAYIKGLNQAQPKPLPAERVKEPNTVLCIELPSEPGTEKCVIIMEPGAMVLEHGHSRGVKETYSAFTYTNRTYKKRKVIIEDCKIGEKHSLFNNSDYWAIVHLTRKT